MKCKMTTMILLILCAVLFPIYAESNVVADNQSAAANNGSQALANSGGSAGNIAGGSISFPVNISDNGKVSNSKKSFMEQIELLRGEKVGYYVAIFVAAITAILQLLKKTNEYLEKFHVTKKLVRYAALIECCDARIPTFQLI